MGPTAALLRSRTLAALASPHGVDRYLEQVDPRWAAHEVRARVVSVHREVDVPGHRAGQHVQAGVEVDGARRTTRVFTISSPDSRAGDRFTITLRANPSRVVSHYLVERAQPGTMVHLSQTRGRVRAARRHRLALTRAACDRGRLGGVSSGGQTGAMSEPEPEKLSGAEIGKDAVQSTVEAAASTVGEVAVIVTRAVQDIATTIGAFATEVFEIHEASKKAADD